MFFPITEKCLLLFSVWLSIWTRLRRADSVLLPMPTHDQESFRSFTLVASQPLNFPRTALLRALHAGAHSAFKIKSTERMGKGKNLVLFFISGKPKTRRHHLFVRFQGGILIRIRFLSFNSIYIYRCILSGRRVFARINFESSVPQCKWNVLIRLWKAEIKYCLGANIHEFIRQATKLLISFRTSFISLFVSLWAFFLCATRTAIHLSFYRYETFTSLPFSTPVNHSFSVFHQKFFTIFMVYFAWKRRQTREMLSCLLLLLFGKCSTASMNDVEWFATAGKWTKAE